MMTKLFIYSQNCLTPPPPPHPLPAQPTPSSVLIKTTIEQRRVRRASPVSAAKSGGGFSLNSVYIYIYTYIRSCSVHTVMYNWIYQSFIHIIRTYFLACRSWKGVKPAKAKVQLTVRDARYIITCFHNFISFSPCICTYTWKIKVTDLVLGRIK